MGILGIFSSILAYLLVKEPVRNIFKKFEN
jgi:hypothetical protein